MAGANDKSQDNSVIFDLGDIQEELLAVDTDISSASSVAANGDGNNDGFIIELNDFDADVSDIIADYNNPDFIDLTELLDAATPNSEPGADHTSQHQEGSNVTLSSDSEADFITVAEVVLDTATTPLDIVFNILDETTPGSDV